MRERDEILNYVKECMSPDELCEVLSVAQEELVDALEEIIDDNMDKLREYIDNIG